MTKHQLIAYQNPFSQLPSAPPHNKFVQFEQEGKRRFAIILTIEPVDAGLAWHCSMSIGTAIGAKIRDNWSSQEKQTVLKKMQTALAKVGDETTDSYVEAHFSLNLFRNLTDEEKSAINI